jgi:hypothetical protein
LERAAFREILSLSRGGEERVFGATDWRFLRHVSRPKAAQLAWALWSLSVALLGGEVVFAILNGAADFPASYGAVVDKGAAP